MQRGAQRFRYLPKGICQENHIQSIMVFYSHFPPDGTPCNPKPDVSDWKNWGGSRLTSFEVPALGLSFQRLTLNVLQIPTATVNYLKIGNTNILSLFFTATDHCSSFSSFWICLLLHAGRSKEQAKGLKTLVVLQTFLPCFH